MSSDLSSVASHPRLRILLANPRGFCAGVERAIRIVENALIKYGAPIYVRHEIVHNRHVVEGLKAKGAIFVDEVDDVPDDGRVIFSAHGVAKAVVAEAKNRHLHYIDATCPLVSKVHKGAERFYRDGAHLILIGHTGHPEVIGTMGQLPPGSVTLIETENDIAKLNFPRTQKLAYVTQTTLSVHDTAGIIAQLTKAYPDILSPKRGDICYATSNRQQAVSVLAQEAHLILVIGAENSSNSKRLVEVARLAGCEQVHLINTAADIDWEWFAQANASTEDDKVFTLGLTAGASAPESLVNGVINACEKRFAMEIGLRTVAEENISFRLPSEIADVGDRDGATP